MDTVAPPQILLVDDDNGMREAFAQTLHYRLPKITVDVCGSVPLALERLRSTDYHAIVTDLSMPGMSGLTLLEEVQRDRPHCPVLFMTGRTEEELVGNVLKNGAYDVIYKPIDREQAILAVRRAIEMSELRLFCERQDALVVRLFQQLRQLQQVLRPFLLSSLKALSRELGDERIEQSRSMIENAVSLCATQNRLTRRRLDFIEQFLEGTKRRLDSAESNLPHL